MQKERFNVNLAVHLALLQDDSVLLLQRHNTGYADGWYTFIAGHAEEGESLTEGMIRETEEEVGIIIKPEDLTVAHIMYRQSNRPYIDVFFTCSKWSGTPRNCELNKCTDLQFFPKDKLPEPCLSYVPLVLNYIQKGVPFSEHTTEI